MAAFFNLAILDWTIFVLPLILTQTCQEWFPPFAQKKLTHISLPTICTKNLHPFILTQLDDGSHLEFCHVEFSHLEQNSDSEFRHCHLGFRHLVIFSQIHSKTHHSTLTLNQTNSIWLKLIPSQVNWWWQPSWILPSWIQLFCTKRNFTYFFWLNLIMAAILNSAILDSSIFEQNSDAN